MAQNINYNNEINETAARRRQIKILVILVLIFSLSLYVIITCTSTHIIDWILPVITGSISGTIVLSSLINWLIDL